MLEKRKDRAAVWEARVRDAGEFELGAGGQTAEIERFEGGVWEVETAVEEGV